MVDPTSYIKHLLLIMRTSYNLPCDENVSVVVLSTTPQQVHVMLQQHQLALILTFALDHMCWQPKNPR